MVITEKEEITFDNIPNLRERLYNMPRDYNMGSYEEYYLRVIVKKALSFANKEDCISYLNGISLLYKRKILEKITI